MRPQVSFNREEAQQDAGQTGMIQDWIAKQILKVSEVF